MKYLIWACYGFIFVFFLEVNRLQNLNNENYNTMILGTNNLAAVVKQLEKDNSDNKKAIVTIQQDVNKLAYLLKEQYKYDDKFGKNIKELTYTMDILTVEIEKLGKSR